MVPKTMYKYKYKIQIQIRAIKSMTTTKDLNIAMDIAINITNCN